MRNAGRSAARCTCRRFGWCRRLRNSFHHRFLPVADTPPASSPSTPDLPATDPGHPRRTTCVTRAGAAIILGFRWRPRPSRSYDPGPGRRGPSIVSHSALSGSLDGISCPTAPSMSRRAPASPPPRPVLAADRRPGRRRPSRSNGGARHNHVPAPTPRGPLSRVTRAVVGRSRTVPRYRGPCPAANVRWWRFKVVGDHLLVHDSDVVLSRFV